MANPVWPVSLPQDPLIDGYDERAPDVLARTEMDAGPDKVRRRFTAGVRPMRLTVALTRTQVQTLDDFHVTTLQGGALPFDWTHPRTLATVAFRFTEPPSYKPQSQTDWLAALALEILP